MRSPKTRVIGNLWHWVKFNFPRKVQSQVNRSEKEILKRCISRKTRTIPTKKGWSYWWRKRPKSRRTDEQFSIGKVPRGRDREWIKIRNTKEPEVSWGFIYMDTSNVKVGYEQGHGISIVGLTDDLRSTSDVVRVVGPVVVKSQLD